MVEALRKEYFLNDILMLGHDVEEIVSLKVLVRFESCISIKMTSFGCKAVRGGFLNLTVVSIDNLFYMYSSLVLLLLLFSFLLIAFGAPLKDNTQMQQVLINGTNSRHVGVLHIFLLAK